MSQAHPAPPIGAYLPIGRAATLLGVSVGILRNWNRAGKPKPHRHPLSSYRLYRPEELDALLVRIAASGPDGEAAE